MYHRPPGLDLVMGASLGAVAFRQEGSSGFSLSWAAGPHWALGPEEGGEEERGQTNKKCSLWSQTLRGLGEADRHQPLENRFLEQLYRARRCTDPYVELCLLGLFKQGYPGKANRGETLHFQGQERWKWIKRLRQLPFDHCNLWAVSGGLWQYLELCANQRM